MTLNELYQQTLERLQKATPGGSVAAEDTSKLAEKYTHLHALLLTENLVTWAVTETIPDKVSDPVVAMLAYLVANDFGVPEPRYSRLRLEGALFSDPPSLAERQLRKAVSHDYVPSPLKTDYF